ncbi:acetolactate synthase [Candidatus Nomurabacteria bacterium RIFCSPLOWO2_01_FULL_42_17]|uniref:Acetolactate synthase n=1 Tax=Candidatus Nomurabacteria bacterium RIFCSPLOWO2_01_FULL_42_17 TaxID=1801780 RepID=A0A1F6XM71_9BACT|nr:MAG: acetolactate synthase [Candidatus Nomurabacteria bacterium RIFCSPLOWO2_01_FULL_42_17]
MAKTAKNVAEIIVNCLEKHGIKYIFGVPGEENLTFLEAVKNSKITFITTRTEQGAAFMAATVGRMTGKVGVALSTLGPGATNLMTGVAYAELGGFPLLVITGQKAIKKNKQGKFQIIDVVGMMKTVTKFSKTITAGDQVPSMMSEAISLAETERPGAVHLELPEDIAEESCDAVPLDPKKIIYNKADDKSINLALNEIQKSKHPIIILGGGLNRQTNKIFLRKAIDAFLKKTGIPFVSTQMGKGAGDETSQLYIGTTALSQGEYVHQALRHADLILMIGHDVIEKPPMILTAQKIIHINFFSSMAPDVYVPTHEVIGDISHTLLILTKKLSARSEWDFDYFFKMRDMLKKDIATFSQSPDFPLRPERIISDIQKTLQKGDILALDNGMYKLYFARNFISREFHGIILDNTLATMGAGLPAGISLKILYPNKKVLVVSGDGGIMMSVAELETAVRLGINLVVLILDDSGFGMIRWKQKGMNLSSFGLSFNNPDFMTLAKSFGAVGYKVKKTEALLPFLEKALNSKGVHIIVCPINYEEANEYLGKIV